MRKSVIFGNMFPGLFFQIFLCCLAVCISTCSGQILDYSVTPRPQDNFLEADFRFVNPNLDSNLKGILVYVPGTDGDARQVVENPRWLATCRACHAALIGCYFRGEELAYDIPDGGSGRALDEAISYFAGQVHLRQIIHAPVLLFGYSEGAQFAFNYACLYPERLMAFAAVKPGYLALTPQGRSFQVPGLIAAGENDESGRIRTAAQAFSSAIGRNSKWTFLFEKNAGHELGQSGDFACKFFESACSPSKTGKPVFISIETEASEPHPSYEPSSCWLPDSDLIMAWKLLHRPVALQTLMSMPDRPELSSFINATMNPDRFECESGHVQSGTLNLSVGREGAFVHFINVTGDGFSIDGPATGELPVRMEIHFSPFGSNWGPAFGHATIEGTVNGKRANPINITIPAAIIGPVVPSLRLIYMGIAQSGQTVNKSIVLRSRGLPARIANILAPNDIAVTVKPDKENNLVLNVRWTAGSRLGKLSEEIRLTFYSPEVGTLHIPILAVITRSNR